jgi:uncharacterized protein (DUF1697 family)
MTDYIGLLRAVNLAGYNRIAMADLRDLLTGLGFTACRTLLQSGNIVFSGDRRPAAQLERTLEAHLEQDLRVTTDFFVRTAKEWEALVANNPFPREAHRDPAHLVAMVLKDQPSPEAVQQLEAAITGDEEVRTQGRHAYIVYTSGIGRSRLTNALIEKKLRTRGTGRNWNTVLKLQRLINQR